MAKRSLCADPCIKGPTSGPLLMSFKVWSPGRLKPRVSYCPLVNSAPERRSHIPDWWLGKINWASQTQLCPFSLGTAWSTGGGGSAQPSLEPIAKVGGWVNLPNPGLRVPKPTCTKFLVVSCNVAFIFDDKYVPWPPSA